MAGGHPKTYQTLIYIGSKIFKVCSRCKEQKEVDCFSRYWRGGTNRYKSGCKLCLNASLRAYKKGRPLTEEARKKATINNTRYKRTSRTYNEKARIINLKRYYRNKETLNDLYIKQLLIKNNNLSMKEVPQELIDLKRKELILKNKINGKINQSS